MYWGYFLAKLIAIAGLLSLVWTVAHSIWPVTERFTTFARDLGYTFSVMMFSLAGAGLVYLAILDQRYRCRTCLRRLRMPVSKGAWNHIIFLGPPRTEYICPYGHGTLRVPDLHLASPEAIDWRPIDDMWKELYELEASHK